MTSEHPLLSLDALIQDGWVQICAAGGEKPLIAAVEVALENARA